MKKLLSVLTLVIVVLLTVGLSSDRSMNTIPVFATSEILSEGLVVQGPCPLLCRLPGGGCKEDCP